VEWPITPSALGNWDVGDGEGHSSTLEEYAADVSLPVKVRERPWMFSLPCKRWVSPVWPGSDSEPSTSLVDKVTECLRMCFLNTGPISEVAFRDRVIQRLGLHALGMIHTLKLVAQPNGNHRVDIWVQPETAGYLKRRINGQHKKLGGWRAVLWQTWVDRHVEAKDDVPKRWQRPPTAMPKRVLISTYNVNGWRGKREQIAHYLAREGVTVALLQETLVYAQNQPIKHEAYDVFVLDVPKGQVSGDKRFFVHKGLKATSMDLNDSHIMGIRTSKIPGDSVLQHSAPFHHFRYSSPHTPYTDFILLIYNAIYIYSMIE
jgi:hypothetical protein